ncbi:MAG: hypothetical protein AAF629_28850 [Chloroflexota bacterium]
MIPSIQVGQKMPDFALPDHRGLQIQLSQLIRPTTYDTMLGFDDRYPIIVVFYRGFY